MKFYCETCKTVIEIGFPVLKENGTWKPDHERCSCGDLSFDGYCPCCGYLMRPIPNYETPEQYEQRIGKPYPDYGAVWVLVWNRWYKKYEWLIRSFKVAVQEKWPKGIIVIADPPLPPPDNWRP